MTDAGTTAGTGSSRTPRLSIVVVIYNMEREAKRSLYSMSARYQHDVSEDDYEVVVVDNGSDRPFNGGSVAEFGPNFRYHYVADARESREKRTPARAMNIGVAMARSDYFALMIDGARILTPGVVKYGLLLLKMFPKPCGLTLGWHIGPKFQPLSVIDGYNQTIEDALIETIDWPSNGYRLFEISAPHADTDGWFRLVGESNCTFVQRDVLAAIGGFDERYIEVAGGLVNLDVQTQLYDRTDIDLVMLIGEGTFHQYHGGATSSTPWPDIPRILDEFSKEHLAIRGRPFNGTSERRPNHVGHMPIEALRFLNRFIEAAHPIWIEVDKTVAFLKSEWENGERIIQHRDEAIAWLRDEVAHRDRVIAELQGAIAATAATGGPSGMAGAGFTPATWFSWVKTRAAAAGRKVSGQMPSKPEPTSTRFLDS